MENVTVKDVLRLPGEGEKTASDMVIKARTADLAGDFSVMEGTIYPNELLAPHTHEYEAQLVYIITGELEFEVGGKDGLRFTAPAGSYIIKPRGIMHAFWNKKEVESRYIELSGKEHFEEFVDSKSKGDLHAIIHSKDHGMTTHMTDTLRLMKTHNLKGLSMMEFPSLPKLPDWFRNLLPKKEKV
ncbi:cupin domain-containing protein [Aureispira anguillae]|uniref:Cupin domain-containing protein n=1 Tax=Aureispira anguillae TaxID=2864201 RepID=A0A915YC99_9BACT|nr:cupin domain-containing protein [Aureispira anguillae]BDS10440.1 cupin domain-containing protein [Aureispira anguillae]